MPAEAPLVHAKQPSAGFTLLELLVVLTILALLAIFMPSITAGSGARIRAAGRDLASDLRALRGDAIRGRRVTELTLDRDHRRYRLDPSGETRILPGDGEISFSPGAPPLVGETVQQVAFYPDGSSTGGTIALTDGGMRFAVRIEWLSGQVTLDE